MARTRLLGAEHPSTLTSRGSLASVLHDLGRLEEAERSTAPSSASALRCSAQITPGP